MHMADALLSPAVGGAMWAATGVTVAYSARKVRNELDESKIPLMGVAGAFVFAAQMLTFAIPGTGSSGHLGGALILAILLGPEAAFLVMASILAVQALFFADGGLLALGANIFNLGFFPAFIAYPLIYRRDRRQRLASEPVAHLRGQHPRRRSRPSARRPRSGTRDDRLGGHGAALRGLPAPHAADPSRHRRR